jgi:hypothetical protein
MRPSSRLVLAPSFLALLLFPSLAAAQTPADAGTGEEQGAAPAPELARTPEPEPSAPIEPPLDARDSEVAALRDRLAALEAREAARDAEEAEAEIPAAPPGPPITFIAEQGRGFTLTAGPAFSSSIMARLQLRNTVSITDDDADPDHDPEVTNELSIRTLRLWWRGNVLLPSIRYAIQLALGANDFEPGNPSPIFDAYLDIVELRDLSFRIGQFFVPFDRARTIREFALQSVDRADVVRELTLDRDVGIAIYSNDFLGWGGRLAYQVGVFGGDGRNRIGARDPGFLYVARVSVRPFGAFDDDQEGDTLRTAEPRLAIGGAVAFNHQTDRPRSTTGTPYEGGITFDYVHAAADVVFKYRGFATLAEVVYRQATTPSRMRTLDDGTVTTVFARDGWGWLLQASTMIGSMFEVWARWEQTVAIGATDPTLVTQGGARGHGVGGGVNLYLNAHFMKVQLDWAHSFGDDFGLGPHLVRLQLDVSF